MCVAKFSLAPLKAAHKREMLTQSTSFLAAVSWPSLIYIGTSGLGLFSLCGGSFFPLYHYTYLNVSSMYLRLDTYLDVSSMYPDVSHVSSTR